MSNETWINARKRDNTTIHDAFLQDANLTVQAKGLLCVILSVDKFHDPEKPKKLELKNLTELSANGRDAHFNYANELEQHGYLCRVRTIVPIDKEQESGKKKFGKIYYIFSDIKEEVQAGLESLKEYLQGKGIEFFVMTDGKGKRKKALHPENQDMVKNEENNPHPDFQDTESPDTENQDESTLVHTKAFVLNTYVCMYVGDVIDKFKYFFPDKASKYAKITLSDLCKDMPVHLVEAAIERAVIGEASNPIAYIKNVIKKWKSAEIQTVEALDQYEKEFYEKRKQISSDKKGRDSKHGSKGNKPPKSQLPKAVAMQLEKEKNGGFSTVSPEEKEQNEKRLKEKLKEMDEALAKRNRVDIYAM
ncbi:Replication initiation and membrane attachment [Thermoactinomyces sp. DSM 45891]|uniref:DnaD domain protein n=1 Tax=Thermoactinomyces sp. DSM 45891 TaxID=1761907 RepID=UPI00091A6D8C|nr:DnaD domain protein [Thermoactinomyces sp. DSM 45891]SFX75189.1 Replication initiation and membrane attachment [Thermoactinomyces sp. DSM 45891]